MQSNHQPSILPPICFLLGPKFLLFPFSSTWHIDPFFNLIFDLAFVPKYFLCKLILPQFESHSVCKYDYLTMTDGDGTILMGKTCGTSSPNNITSASNVIKMVFKTDQSNTREGWSLSWRAVLPGVSFPKIVYIVSELYQ